MLSRIISLLLSTVILFGADIRSARVQLDADISSQIQRIEQLEKDYKQGKIAHVDESSFYDGDLIEDLRGGVRFNELSFIATHNSYQTESLPQFRQIYKNLSQLTFGLVSADKGGLDSETLTEQFNLGIRSIEMDIETKIEDGEISFVCLHSPVTDMTTNSYDFALALKEIKMWSDYNPNHLPITIIIEPKKASLPMKNLKRFNLKYANALDELLRSELGDILMTPADMLGDYESFEQMRSDNGWREVRDMLGKVLVLLHDTAVTDKYISQDKSIRSQAMFPMLRYKDKDETFAGFLLINDPKDALKYSEEIIDGYNLIMRTQADKYTDHSQQRLNNALLSRAQIFSTDYPLKSGETKETYFVYFGDHKTVRRIK